MIMENNILIYRNCPLCNSNDFKTLYKRNYNIKNIKEELFSARRERKKRTYEHNTFLKCNVCGMVYSNPIINPSVVNKLYEKSKYNYKGEEENLKNTYKNFLSDMNQFIKNKQRLLDIGTGNGFFLLEALKQGYKEVYGIEPSKHAVEMADNKIKKNIIQDILKEDQFKDEFFDAITLFQVIDHIENPNGVLRICNKFLKKNGAILFISHNVDSLSSKILGEKSPIFDIEHTQLFSVNTMTKILKKNGFKVIYSYSVPSTFTLGHWITMTPIPKKIKDNIKEILKKTGLIDKTIKMRPGNFGIIALKK